MTFSNSSAVPSTSSGRRVCCRQDRQPSQAATITAVGPRWPSTTK
nr:hypothetical protein [Streptomyces sudanensis]